VPLALTLGIIAGVFELVPYLGPRLSVVPAALMALLEGPQDRLNPFDRQCL
jgi:predicted PurR-regulated permease PerM